MKKLSFLLIAVLCACTYLPAQREYNIWYFGENSGLNFNTNPPTNISSKLKFYEAGSGVCDKKGNLLFFTDGDTIYDPNLNIMQGGTSPNYHFFRSSMQGTMVLPVQNKPGLYFKFSSPCLESNTVSKGNMYYSIIDMNANNGLGAVKVDNKQYYKNTRDRDVPMSVALHANGKDYWVAAPSWEKQVQQQPSQLVCIRTIDDALDTVNPPVETPVAAAGSHQVMRFSPDSKMIYVPTSRFLNNQIYYSLFKFDNATGKVSDEIFVPSSPSVEFSHDSRYLYIRGGVSNHIYQYDLKYWHPDSIMASEKVVLYVTDRREVSHLHLGPDKKIYIFFTHNELAIIHRPFEAGDNCKPQDHAMQLLGPWHGISRPYFPTFWFKDLIVDLGPDTILCAGNKIEIIPYTAPEATLLWSTGETSRTIQVDKPGKYWVRVILGKDTATDEVEVFLQDAPPITQTLDTGTCKFVTLSIPPQPAGVTYVWNTGDTSRSINVTEKGKYSVTVRYKYCTLTTNSNVELLAAPDSILEPDTSLCGHRDITLRALDGNKFLWSTGETTPTITVAKEGMYSLTVSRNNCTGTDSIYVGPQCYLECYIPNAFTPNGDGINNVFAPECIDMKSYEMTIFNRWGQVIYNCQNCAWDGTYAGQLVPQGAYMYLLVVTARSKRKESIFGNIMVLR